VTIQELGSLGEFIAALATIATLAYLAIQIHQNTKSQISNATFQALDPMWDMTLAPTQETDLARVLVKGLKNFDSLDEEERLQFVFWAMNLLYAYDNFVGLYEQKMVPQATLENAILSVDWLFRSPGLRQYSKTRNGPRSATLESYLDKCPNEYTRSFRRRLTCC